MTKRLSSEEVERYRGLLQRLRAEMAGDIDHLAADAFSGDGEKLSVDSPADTGSDSYAQEFSLELLQRDEANLASIEGALERIEEGSFGRCEGCGHWIPRTRLDAMPFAVRCVNCQRRAEAEG